MFASLHVKLGKRRSFSLVCVASLQLTTKSFHAVLSYKHNNVTIKQSERKRNASSGFNPRDGPGFCEGDLRRRGAVCARFGTRNTTRRLCHIKSAARNKSAMCTNNTVSNTEHSAHMLQMARCGWSGIELVRHLLRVSVQDLDFSTQGNNRSLRRVSQ